MSQKVKVNIEEAKDVMKDQQVLGAIIRVAIDMGEVDEDGVLTKECIKETLLKALGTQSFFKQQLNNREKQLYIQTPNEKLNITQKR